MEDRMRVKFIFLILLSLLIFETPRDFFASPAHAQEESNSATEVEKDPRLTEAELNAAIAEAKKKEAEALKAEVEAKQAIFAAKLPSSDTAGVDGKVTLGDGTGYYAEILAYDSLVRATDSIAQKVSTAINPNQAANSGKSVILIGSLDYSSDFALHNLISSELQRVIASLEKLRSNPVIQEHTLATPNNAFISNDAQSEVPIAGLIASVPGVLGVARDISKFFQTELTTKNRAVTLKDSALTASMAGSLIGTQITPIIPSTSTSPLGSFTNSYQTLQTLRDEISDRQLIAETYAEQQKTTLDSFKTAQGVILTKLQAELKELKTAKKPTAAKESEIMRSKEITAAVDKELLKLKTKKELIVGRLQAGIVTADKLTTTLTTANTEGLTPFQAVSVVDTIKSNSTQHMLFVEVVSHGAEIQTTRKAFSGNVNYIGGVNVSYVLLSGTGDVRAAGTDSKLDAKTFKRGKPIEGMIR